MTVQLVDLSNNNAAPDFHALAAAGITGVYLKVTEGVLFVDETWPQRATHARQAGLRVGGYHFFHPAVDAPQQAAYFAEHLGPIGPHDLKPALDCEATDGLQHSQVVAPARTFNRELVRRVHVGPLFYSFTSFIEQLGADKPIGYGLWLADFGPDDGHEHPVTPPAPWRRIVLHQYTSTGHIDGISGDVDRSSAASLRPLLAHPPPRV